jgi:aldose 1-epimerase
MGRKRFGTTADGDDVDQFDLQNRNGVIARCVNYGCRITNILLPSASGHTDIVVGPDSLPGCEADASGMGALAGRHAGVIGGAEFSIGDKTYKLTNNDGRDFIDGSLSKRVFSAERETASSVVFTASSPDGEDGFPGELELEVRYSLDDDDRLSIEYSARSDKATYLNLAARLFFDLSGGIDETIENHLLRLESGKYLETEGSLPTGKVLDAKGTPLDFTHQRTIGRDMASGDPSVERAGGYDHFFPLAGDGGLSLAAEACAPDGDLSIRVFTTQPALRLYTGNKLDGGVSGKGRAFTRHSAFCLEPQGYPDTPNRPEFPSALLAPGKAYHERTVLQFGF